jgi:hypothetical protein
LPRRWDLARLVGAVAVGPILSLGVHSLRGRGVRSDVSPGADEHPGSADEPPRGALGR